MVRWSPTALKLLFSFLVRSVQFAEEPLRPSGERVADDLLAGPVGAPAALVQRHGETALEGVRHALGVARVELHRPITEDGEAAASPGEESDSGVDRVRADYPFRVDHAESVLVGVDDDAPGTAVDGAEVDRCDVPLEPNQRLPVADGQLVGPRLFALALLEIGVEVRDAHPGGFADLEEGDLPTPLRVLLEVPPDRPEASGDLLRVVAPLNRHEEGGLGQPVHDDRPRGVGQPQFVVDADRLDDDAGEPPVVTPAEDRHRTRAVHLIARRQSRLDVLQVGVDPRPGVEADHVRAADAQCEPVEVVHVRDGEVIAPRRVSEVRDAVGNAGHRRPLVDLPGDPGELVVVHHQVEGPPASRGQNRLRHGAVHVQEVSEAGGPDTAGDGGCVVRLVVSPRPEQFVRLRVAARGEVGVEFGDRLRLDAGRAEPLAQNPVVLLAAEAQHHRVVRVRLQELVHRHGHPTGEPTVDRQATVDGHNLEPRHVKPFVVDLARGISSIAARGTPPAVSLLRSI